MRVLQAETTATTAPCPKCRSDMVLAVVIPHPIASQLAKHTYLCSHCNQTKTYILPVAPSAAGDEPGATSESDERRRERREALAAPATIYDKDGSFLFPCTVRDLSKSGGRLELFKEAILPRY